MKREINGHTLYFVKIAVLMENLGDGSARAKYFQTLAEAEKEYESQNEPFSEGPSSDTLVFEFINGDLKFIGEPEIEFDKFENKCFWTLKGIGRFENESF